MLWKAVVLIICFSVGSHAQIVLGDKTVESKPDDKQTARKIFDAENKTIAIFSKRHPVVETYLQSLDDDATPHVVIDDAYFLSRVALNPEEKHHYIDDFAFGRSETSKLIKWNNDTKWPLIPNGYVAMLFASVSAFDADDYDLRYVENERVGNIECLKYTVVPIDPKFWGYFSGSIWVEPKGFHIVRMAGRFTPKHLAFFGKINPFGISDLGIYLSFDARRQEVSPGVWLPAYIYFDDTLLWNQAKYCASYHFRGHVWVWGYDDIGNEKSLEPGKNSALARLEAAGLIATPGPVESWLDGTVHDIRASAHLSGPEVHCRVLMTTPLEIVSENHSILVSRGLLNAVPNRSVLAVLLARELAKMELGYRVRGRRKKNETIFDRHRPWDFDGFRVDHDRGKENQLDTRLLEILKQTEYTPAIAQAEKFESGLQQWSRQVPHLTVGRLGFGLVEDRQRPARHSAVISTPLTLGNSFGINVWSNQITIFDGSIMPVEPSYSALREPGSK